MYKVNLSVVPDNHATVTLYTPATVLIYIKNTKLHSLSQCQLSYRSATVDEESQHKFN